MLINSIVNKLVLPRVGATKFALEKHSPELLLVGGILAGVGCVIAIAKGHKKSPEILATYECEKELIQIEIDFVEEEEEREISDVERRGAMLPAHVGLVGDVVKAYGPGVVLGFGAVAMILASHNIQAKRLKAVAGALAVVQSGFSTYRARVREELGAEADERFYYGGREQKVAIIEETEDGKFKKRRVKKTLLDPEQQRAIYYQRDWQEGHTRWQPDRTTNELILRASQNHMNDLLNIYGYVYLNQVLADLGFETAHYGQAIGWSLKTGGDNFIDYGLDAEINSNEDANFWRLDFNCNGYILNDGQ